MIRWFSVNDILAGYAISKSKLLSLCRNGHIGAMKFRDGRYKKGNYQYLIPEAELIKLAELKTGEPLFKPEHQPSEFLTPKNFSIELDNLHKVSGNYNDYLLSEAWLNVRLKRLQLDGFQCQMCGTAKNLRVHHIHYEHLGMPEEIHDIITLCDECHSKIHVKDL